MQKTIQHNRVVMNFPDNPEDLGVKQKIRTTGILKYDEIRRLFFQASKTDNSFRDLGKPVQLDLWTTVVRTIHGGQFRFKIYKASIFLTQEHTRLVQSGMFERRHGM